MDGSKDEVFQYARERYSWEHERKNELNNSVTIPLGIIIIQISSMSYFISNFPCKSHVAKYYIFLILLIISILLISFSILMFIKQQIGYKYAYISNPIVFDKFRNEYICYFEKIKQPVNDAKITFEIEETQYSQYLEATEINITNNEKKIEYYRFLLLSSILSTVLIIVTLFFSIQLDKSIEPTRVYIENLQPRSIIMSDNEDEKPAETPQPPVRPSIKLVTESYKPNSEIRQNATDTPVHIKSEDD